MSGEQGHEGVAEGAEVGEQIPPLTMDEQKAIIAALKVGAPRALAGRAAGRPDLELLMLRDPQLAADVDQAEAIAEVMLLEGVGRTKPLEVLARLKPATYGVSVARPLPDTGADDDGLDLD